MPPRNFVDMCVFSVVVVVVACFAYLRARAFNFFFFFFLRSGSSGKTLNNFPLIL